MKPIPTETATDVGSVGRWLGAAAAGALLMYLLDPDRGSARRSRTLSALRTAGARTGATVDHALHNAGDRLVGLKDSAAGALSRGAGRLQAQAAPLIERARHGAREATHRFEDGAERIRARAKAELGERGSERDDRGYGSYAGPDTDRGPGRAERYEKDRQYRDEQREQREYRSREQAARARGRSNSEAEHMDAAHSAMAAGGTLGLLGLMRRKPGGLLVGLAGLALLWQATRDKTYRVGDNRPGALARMKNDDEHTQANMIPPGEQSSSRYLH